MQSRVSLAPKLLFLQRLKPEKRAITAHCEDRQDGEIANALTFVASGHANIVTL